MAVTFNKIVRGAIEILAFTVLSMIVWAAFWAEPNAITKTEVSPLVSKPGGIVRILNYSDKAEWAAKFCTLIDDRVFIVDADGSHFERSIEGIKNYNDGSIPFHVTEMLLPKDIAPGVAKVYKSLTYTCFGFFEHRIFTARGRWGTVVIGPHPLAGVAS